MSSGLLVKPMGSKGNSLLEQNGLLGFVRWFAVLMQRKKKQHNGGRSGIFGMTQEIICFSTLTSNLVCGCTVDRWLWFSTETPLVLLYLFWVLFLFLPRESNRSRSLEFFGRTNGVRFFVLKWKRASFACVHCGLSDPNLTPRRGDSSRGWRWKNVFLLVCVFL